MTGELVQHSIQACGTPLFAELLQKLARHFQASRLNFNLDAKEVQYYYFNAKLFVVALLSIVCHATNKIKQMLLGRK